MVTGEGDCAIASDGDCAFTEDDDWLSTHDTSHSVDSCDIKAPSLSSLIDLNETIAETAGFAMPPKRNGVVYAASIGVP